MDSKGESLETVPLLSVASGSTESLDVDESPKPKPQHPIPPPEHHEDSDTERPAGSRAAVVMMPDGSIVPVSSTAAPVLSAHRTDVSSVERSHQPTVPYSGASTPATDLQTLPTKSDAVPGPAPNHIPRKQNMPVPGPAPEGHPQQIPAQHMYPAAPPQYQPYQPPPAVQYPVPGPATPYEQPRPQTVERKPIRTSKTFDSNTMSHNQYYLSICLCITLILFCNPMAVICCIPAFYYANKAANENKNDNYNKALRFEKNAQLLNTAGFVYLVTAGVLFFLLFTAGVSGVSVYVSNASRTSNSA